MEKEPELLLQCLKDDGKIYTFVYPPEGYSYKHFGLLIADVIRHTANAFKVPEDYVFDWVKREMLRPTTDIAKIEIQ